LESEEKPTTTPGDKPSGETAPAAVTTTPAAPPDAPARPTPAPAGTPPVKTEIPSGTPPAARVAPGAAKSTTTPTASAAKGVPKAVAAKQSPTTVVEAPPDPPVNKMRRRIVWLSIAGFFAAIGMATMRFFLPRAIMEPSSVFRIGFPGDYSLGVDTKWQQQYRIWVVKSSDRLFAIYARCTHLGCTPDWKASENKFKCPCHGSGYDSDGINFEGPAPRPMDRAHIELDAEGQLVVDTNRLYMREKGKADQFDEEGAFIQV
jgi:cytochrome b6-f complex iron-sulfur subunit